MHSEEAAAWGPGRTPALAASVELKVHTSRLGEKTNEWPWRWMEGPGERRGEDTNLEVISTQNVTNDRIETGQEARREPRRDLKEYRLLRLRRGRDPRRRLGRGSRPDEETRGVGPPGARKGGHFKEEGIFWEKKVHSSQQNIHMSNYNERL